MTYQQKQTGISINAPCSHLHTTFLNILSVTTTPILFSLSDTHRITDRLLRKISKRYVRQVGIRYQFYIESTARHNQVCAFTVLPYMVLQHQGSWFLLVLNFSHKDLYLDMTRQALYGKKTFILCFYEICFISTLTGYSYLLLLFVYLVTKPTSLDIVLVYLDLVLFFDSIHSSCGRRKKLHISI